MLLSKIISHKKCNFPLTIRLIHSSQTNPVLVWLKDREDTIYFIELKFKISGKILLANFIGKVLEAIFFDNIERES